MVARIGLRALHTARAVRQAAPAAPAGAAAPGAQIAPQVVSRPVVKPVRRVGALRGGFTGFLFGVTLTGAAAYYYLLDEYQAGQHAVLADVVALRTSLQDLRLTVDDIRKQANQAAEQPRQPVRSQPTRA